MWLKLILYVIEIGLLIWSLFTPSGRDAWGWFFNNVVASAFKQATPLVEELAPDIEAVAKSFSDAIGTHGDQLIGALGTDFQKIATQLLTAQRGALAGLGESTPANAIDSAAEAFKVAMGAGLTSAGIAALFEAVFPEKLNTLNGVAPMIAKMAGFDEVAAEVLGPLYKNAFGRSLEYQYRSLFKPELPDEADAVTWHSRGLLTDDQLRVIFGFSGLKSEYEQPFVDSAYRALQPRALTALLQDAPFDENKVGDLLQFAGLRPKDIDYLLPLLRDNGTRNVRQQYLTAAVRSTELGTMTPTELDQVLTDIHYSDEAKNYVQLTVATRKLEQLAELYRKSISEAYRYGQITDDQYVPALEAIGIAAPDAEAHYAIDSIAKRGRESAAFMRAEAKAAAALTRAASSAALASYRAGTIDDAALLAALIAAGVDPAIAAFQVTVAVERKQGPLVFVYGLELSRRDALVLKENVAAVEAQYKKQLIDDAQAAAALSQLEIPERNATALLATWAALKVKPTTTGEKLPR